jgi:hypothetical protein
MTHTIYAGLAGTGRLAVTARPAAVGTPQAQWLVQFTRRGKRGKMLDQCAAWMPTLNPWDRGRWHPIGSRLIPPEQPLAAQLIRHWVWEQEQVRRAWFDPRLGEPWPEDREPAPPAGPAPYGWGPGQLNPPPPAPGMRHEWFWSPS